MKIKKISWYDEFNCMGGQCPYTCCRGWLIPLDEEDLARFMKERGFLGLRLFTATAAYTRTRMNLGSGECSFHTKEGLCSMQLKKGHDFIPWACRSYPRFFRNYGLFEERYLDLSCIAAAKMFIENTGSLSLIEDEDEPATALCTTNDDHAFLDILVKIRKDILDEFLCDKETDLLSDRKCDTGTVPLSHLMGALFDYSHKLQDLYACGRDHNDLPAFKEFFKQSDPDDSNFPLKSEILKEFVTSAIYHFGQKKTGPTLHALLTAALDLLEHHGNSTASLKDMADKLCNKNEIVIPILNAYMSYYLYQYFLGAYETYSFRRITAIGIIHTNMILLLALTEAANGCDLASDDFARIIAVYNRKVFFNETIENDMYRLFDLMYNRP